PYPTRRSSDLGRTRGGRAERAATQGLTRPGGRSRREGQCAVRVGAAELRSASRTFPEEGHRAGDRYLHAQSRNIETEFDRGESRGGTRTARAIPPRSRAPTP